jgi:GNAT superfamily N-acetyltransferase
LSRGDLFSQALSKPDRYALMVAEYKGESIGFLFCTAGEYLVGYKDLITTVYSYYVRKKYRGSVIGGKAAVRLLSGAVKWSKVRNVREVMIHVTSGINIQRTDKFLRRAGFGVIGANYSLSLANLKDA